MSGGFGISLMAVAVAALLSGGPAAIGGPVSDCNVPPYPGHGSTEVPAVFTVISTDGDDLRYQSATMYFYVGADGTYGRRHGSTAGEPANAIAWNINSASICVASPALGVGYELP